MASNTHTRRHSCKSWLRSIKYIPMVAGTGLFLGAQLWIPPILDRQENRLQQKRAQAELNSHYSFVASQLSYIDAFWNKHQGRLSTQEKDFVQLIKSHLFQGSAVGTLSQDERHHPDIVFDLLVEALKQYPESNSSLFLPGNLFPNELFSAGSLESWLTVIESRMRPYIHFHYEESGRGNILLTMRSTAETEDFLRSLSAVAYIARHLQNRPGLFKEFHTIGIDKRSEYNLFLSNLGTIIRTASRPKHYWNLASTRERLALQLLRPRNNEIAGLGDMKRFTPLNELLIALEKPRDLQMVQNAAP